MLYWLYLFLAIALEITATSLMKLSDGFTKLLPTVGTALGYVACFIFLSFALRRIPLGVAYAIWSSVGIVVLAAIGYFVFHESMSVPKALSLLCIIVGVVGLNLSK